VLRVFLKHHRHVLVKRASRGKSVQKSKEIPTVEDVCYARPSSPPPGPSPGVQVRKRTRG